MSNFENEKYIMRSCKCECFTDTVHNPDGSIRVSLRIRALPDKTLLFAYMPQEGLVRINQKNGKIESRNILGELMGIRDDDREGLMRFFAENGFLFPVTSEGLESFDFEDIFLILRRIKETLNIMSLLQEPRIQYKKIMSAVCWLTLSKRIIINFYTNGQDGFITCLHSYMKYLQKQERRILEALPYDPYTSNDIVITDTVYPPTTTVSVNKLQSSALSDEQENFCLTEYSAAILFLHEEGENIYDRNIIDFFYHLTSEVGHIISIGDKKPEILFSCSDAEVAAKFTTQMRKAIVDVAKITVKEELDYAINAIYPSYDIETMTGTWMIPDLFSALLFSIFYMRPDLELYRKCENPNCGCYFLISTTNSRRKYCSTECSNAVQQRKHRQKRKLALTRVSANN